MVTLEREDVARFKALICQRLGLQFDDSKWEFLSDILRQRVEETGSPPPVYLARLALPSEGRKEFRVLADRLTVAETYFFRNRDHFRAFSAAVLPDIKFRRQATRQLRILSAGCATGDEAYSLAVLLQQSVPDLSTWNVKITAVDLTPGVLERAVRAQYTPWSLRDTPEDVKTRYFRADGRDFRLDDSIRAMVSFEERNLAEDDAVFWHADAFDVVFCRNVLMYFSPEAARAAVARMSRALTPGGYLFLGHAETLRGLSPDFHLCHTHDTFYYRRRDDAPAAAADWLFRPASNLTAPAALSLGLDVSWVDAIQRASERIAALAGAPARTTAQTTEPRAPVVVPARWDLGGTLELMRQERFADALESLRVLPADSQSDADIRLLHAVLQVNGGQLNAAEEICRSLLQGDELNAGAHYLMALCQEHRGDRTAAAEHDHAAIYLDAVFAMPHFHLGLMARRAGDAPTARRELAEALPLLLREDASRILLFGGGFTRDALVSLCRSELRAAEGSA